MNLICCNYDCKYQKEGYCSLNDTSKAEHCGSAQCIYFAPNEKPSAGEVTNSSDERAPL